MERFKKNEGVGLGWGLKACCCREGKLVFPIHIVTTPKVLLTRTDRECGLIRKGEVKCCQLSGRGFETMAAYRRGPRCQIQ